MADLLRLAAEVDVQASAADKPARVSVMAYGGDQMVVAGFGPVAIDLAGLQIPQAVPLLGDHDASLGGVAGSGAPSVQAGRLVLEGTLAASPVGLHIRALAAAGVPLQASVGVEPTDRLAVRAGDSVRVNGREIKAGARGLTLVRAGRLREISITPLGADPTTTVTVTARKPMPPEIQADPTDLQSPDPIASERTRISGILQACAGEHADVQAQAIASGWSVETTKARLFDSAPRVSPALQAMRDGRYHGPAGGGGLGAYHPEPGETIMAACFLMGGHGELLAKLPNGERLANSVKRPSGWSELAAMALREAGLSVPHDRNEVIRAAASMVNLPNAIGSSIAKIALPIFQAQSASWMGIARIVPASNFRSAKALRLAAATKLELLPPTAEIKHGTINEDAFDYKVDPYAKMFILTRTDMINDDASILADLPMKMGMEAAQTAGDLFYTTLIGGAGTYFSSGNGNNATGAGSALGVAGLTAAILAMRTQKDADKRNLNIVPRTLLVPAALEQTAKQLLHSSYVQRDYTKDNLPSGNPFGNEALQLAVEARLDANSATAWYLFGDPLYAPILVAFLHGNAGPIVEGQQAEFDTLGFAYRCILDIGVSLGEPRAAIKNAGA